ncbi:MAG: DUF3553 domain-containing protein [Desulfamplus sp.]|nr:DUF3553 domain-containing protein [Desulfamplus sp.]
MIEEIAANIKKQGNDMTNYKKGDRVKHTKVEDWGVGEVLGSSDGESIDIFFVGAGKKTLAKTARLIKVTGDEALHPLLNNLRKKEKTSKFVSIAQATQYFLKLLPGGFYEENFIDKEREYKIKAHNLSIELLNKDIIIELIQKKEYQEISKRALKVVGATNLIFKNEIMSLNDGLKRYDSQEVFANRLYDLLFGNDKLQNRFEAFSRVLEEIEAAKWTTASYFLFIHFPEEYMFLKPTVTQKVSELCGFEINYKPQLNWLTYSSVLKFSNYLKAALSELQPRDMIDVQSFMWCIERYE